MARIQTYPNGIATSSTKLLGSADPSEATQNYSVADILSVGVTENELKSIGMNFAWSKNDADYIVSSTHTGAPYSKLRVDFSNLVLDTGATYALIIERNRQQTVKDTTGTIRYGGFRQAEPSTSEAPYNARPSSLPITATTGQLFNFRFDLFFKSSTASNPFPSISGANSKPNSSGSGNFTSRQVLSFRIKRTSAAGKITTTGEIGSIILIGQLADGTSTTTFTGN